MTGSMGVLSVDGDITSAADISVMESVGGLISRDGSLDDGPLNVIGSIGDIQASDDVNGTYTSETGSIGIHSRRLTCSWRRHRDSLVGQRVHRAMVTAIAT